MATRYGIYAVQLNGGTLVGVRNQGMNSNNDLDVEGHDGSVNPQSVSLMAHKPSIDISTRALGTILGLLATTGWVALSGSPALALYYRKHANHDEYASGSVHLKGSATQGIVMMQALRAAEGQIVEPQVQIYPTSSTGLTPPITWATSQALAGSLSKPTLFTMGPVVFRPSAGGSVTIRPQSWDLDYQLNVLADMDSGKPYCDTATVKGRGPVARVNGYDLSHVVSDVTPVGVVGALDLYLWAFGTDGKQAAYNSAVHTKLTIGTVYGTTEDNSGDSGAHAQHNLLFTGADTSGQTIVQIDASSELPSSF